MRKLRLTGGLLFLLLCISGPAGCGSLPELKDIPWEELTESGKSGE